MAAGALTNMLVAGIFIAILIVPAGFPLLISPLYNPEPSGALIVDTIPEKPASLAGIKVGYAIIGINTTTDFEDITSAIDFQNYSASFVQPNQTLTFHFAGEIAPITLQTVPRDDNESKGFIGIRTWEYFNPIFYSPSPLANIIPFWIFNTILYTFVVNLMLGMFNLLPVPFLDGDKLLGNFLGPKYQKYLSPIRYYALIVLGLNLIFSFIFTGWQQL
jgi:membrane-associated protease RseP (regulator of RpoE activity)